MAGSGVAGKSKLTMAVWPLNSLIPLEEEKNRAISQVVFAGYPPGVSQHLVAAADVRRTQQLPPNRLRSRRPIVRNPNRCCRVAVVVIAVTAAAAVASDTSAIAAAVVLL